MISLCLVGVVVNIYLSLLPSLLGIIKHNEGKNEMNREVVISMFFSYSKNLLLLVCEEIT